MRKTFHILTLAVFLVTASANAQMVVPIPCADRDDFGNELKKKYDETVCFAGIIDKNRLYEVFCSHKGTWTAVITQIRGLKVCVEQRAAGNHGYAKQPAKDAPI